MKVTFWGKGLPILALLFVSCFGLSLHTLRAQAPHRYAPPTPQRYQRPEAAPASDASEDEDSVAQPQAMSSPASNDDGLQAIGMQVVDFVHEHMVLTFLCILMIAPLWAMSGMRKAKEPYDH